MKKFLRISIWVLAGLFWSSVTRAQAPVADFAIDDTVVCIGSTVNFTDMSVPGGSAITSWQWDFGDGGSSGSQNPSYVYVFGDTMNVSLIVTDALGNTDTAYHVVYVLEAKAIQNVIRICAPQSTTTLIAEPPIVSVANANWFTPGSGVIASPTNDTTLVSNLISGSYIFFWVVSNGICSDADQVTVFVDQPVVASAGPDQQVCSSTGTATMAGSNPSPGTGMWTTASSAVIANPSNRNTTISNLTTAGTYWFYWTVTNGACSGIDSVMITVTDPVLPNAGTDQQFCNQTTATLSGSSPSPGTGLWTTTGSTVITSPTLPTTGVSGLPTGLSSFIWTVTNGACIRRDTVNIINDQLLLANAGVDQTICISNPNTVLAANNPAPGSGVWTALGSGTLVSPSSPSSAVSGLTAGNHSFVWTITNGTCVHRDTMLIRVDTLPPANAGSDATICSQPGSSSLTATNPSPFTGSWSTTSSATLVSPGSSSTLVNGMTTGGVYTFIWSVVNGACTRRDTALITVDQFIPANAGSDQALCEGSPVNLNGNNPAPGTGIWIAQGAGLLSNPNDPNASVSGLSLPGSYSFEWTVLNGLCESHDTVTIIIDSLIPAIAGADQQICSNPGTSNLSATLPANGIAVWTHLGSAVIANPYDPNSAVSNMTSPGTYTFIWTVTNNSCVSRDTLEILVDDPDPSFAGADQSICQTDSLAFLIANFPMIGTGLWSTTGPAVIDFPFSPVTSVSNLQIGTNEFIWTITNGSCPSSDTVLVQVDSLYPSLAGPDQNVCIGQPIQLAAIPTGGTGVWVAISGGVVDNPLDPNSTVSSMSIPGTYYFEWVVLNGMCESRDTITIVLDAGDIANAGPDQQVCAGTGSTVMNANSPSVGTGLWTSTSGASITNPADPQTSITNLVSAGSYEFVWTLSNGSCISSDTMVITVYDDVFSFAGFDQSLCQFDGSAFMFALPAFIGTGTWSTSSPLQFSDPADPFATVTNLAAGSWDLAWTITNGACVASDTVNLTIDSALVANAGIDQTQCSNIDSLQLGGNSFGIGSGLWSTTSTATIQNPADPNTWVGNLSAAGSYEFVWTLTNGLCESTDTVLVSIDQAVVADAGFDLNICQNDSVQFMNALTPLVGAGNWTSSSASAILANPADPGTQVTISSAGIHEFIWTVTNGSCNASDTIYITVDSSGAAIAGPDQSLCETITSTILSAVPAGLGTGVWTHSGTAILVDPLNPSSVVNGLTVGTHEFIWTVLNGLCESHDTMYVVVSALTTPANAGTDTLVCGNSTGISLQANIPAIGTGTWISTGPATVDFPLNATTTVSGLVAGQNTFVWQIINGACSSSDTVSITAATILLANAGADIYTLSGNSVILGGSPAGSGGIPPLNYVWTPASGLNDSLLSNPTATLSADQQFILTITDSLGCTSSDTVMIFINNPPVALDDSSVTCSNDTLTVDLLMNDSDPDGDSLSLSITTFPINGSAWINASGGISYLATSGFNGFDSLVYTVCDNNTPSACDTAVWHIEVHMSPQVLPSVVPVLCYGDSSGGISLAVNGNGPFVYSWSDGSVSPSIDSLIAGNYTVIVTDSFLCQTTSVISISQPLAPLQASLTVSNVACHGDSSGSILVTVNGGTSPYQYQWSNGLNGSSINTLIAGTYSVLVTDTNGCTLSRLDSVLQPASPLSYTLSTNDVLCAGASTGSISISPLGGTPGYFYMWTNGDTDSTADNLSAGVYSVLLLDMNGCYLTAGDTINELNTPLVLNATVTDPNCLNQVYGSISLLVSGGSPQYTYSWTTGDTLPVLDSLWAGTYTVDVTDSLGCTEQLSLALNDTAQLYLTLTAQSICENDSVLLQTAEYAGMNYTWLLNGVPGTFADTSAIHINTAGDYSLLAFSSCGAFASGPVTLTVNPLPVVSLLGDSTGHCDSLFTLEATGGIMYNWSPSQVCDNPNSPIVNLTLSENTLMQVLVTDANGCTSLSGVQMVVACDSLYIPAGFSPNGDGFNDFFEISDIDRYPGADLKIFNRWGALVYQKSSYDNSWDGRSNRASFLEGENLTEGTYFYVLDLKDGSEAYSGFVVIKR